MPARVPPTLPSPDRGRVGQGFVQVMHLYMNTLYVVMVRPLRFADGVFVSQDRRSILAEGAIHVAIAVQRFLCSCRERF